MVTFDYSDGSRRPNGRFVDVHPGSSGVGTKLLGDVRRALIDVEKIGGSKYTLDQRSVIVRQISSSNWFFKNAAAEYCVASSMTCRTARPSKDNVSASTRLFHVKLTRTGLAEEKIVGRVDRRVA